ncbi:uncharacterized protein [Watersipora subatra]|uniref:uncharacterized protein n=1 Tax=Watersipora subatra TaxID=2589382 RepID=UPI00355C1FA5
MATKHLTIFLSVCFLFLSQTVYSEILSYDDEDCIVNPDLPADEENNYVDCNTPEALADNRTRCCDIEGEKGCCENTTQSNKMIVIGTTIGMITAAVAGTCFVVFWCNPDTIPCFQKLPCKCCHRGSDEFTEMTDLTDDIKKTGHSNQMYMRDPEADEFAPPEKYDMPEELKGDVQDDWWGASGTAF